MKIKLKFFLTLAFLFSGSQISASTYNALNCTQAAVQAAIANEVSNPADGDIITIPAGTCAWTGTTPVSATFTRSVTIQGAGAISATTLGASTTGSDQTVLINHMTGNNAPMMIFSTTAGKLFRFTGIALTEDSGSTVINTGLVFIGGKSQSVRVDHVHLLLTVNGEHGIDFEGNVNGVVDHAYAQATTLITNDFRFNNGQGIFSTGDTYGNGSWNQADNFGTSQFMYVEDSRFEGGYGSDCVQGGRWVLRYSTHVNSNGMYQHGTHDQYRGCRASEAYNNTVTGPAPFSDGGMVHPKSGPMMIWGNTVTNFKNVADLDYYRIANNHPYPLVAVPNGFGACGPLASLGPSVWDQNSVGNGYPCLDLPGRGQGDLLTNFVTAFTDVLNSSTGTRTWPHQVRTPVYAWGNTLAGGGAGGNSIIGNRISVLTDNVDYYQQFGPLGEPGSFTGTTGVGQGPVTPTTGGAYTGVPNCTAGPGGNTPGVGWWDTTNNSFYVCNPTNTWSVYYTPFTYPHPLATGGSVPPPTQPAPPTGLTAIPH